MKNLQLMSALLLAFFASAFTFQSTPSTQVRPAAAFDAFLKIEGIPGESKDDTHKGWIELTSTSLETNSGTLTRPTTRCSAQLKKAADQRKVFGKVRIDQRKSDGSYLHIELENVMITSYQISGSGGDRPMESLSINFTKITYVNM